MPIQTWNSLARRVALCLAPVLAGFGAALALLALAGGPARLAYAGTLTYPGCAATIQLCIDGANAGDTILISAGNYTESLTLSKAVSLTGALSSTTILHALPNTRVLTVTGAAVDSSVVISGLTFTGGNVTGTAYCPDKCGGGLVILFSAQPSLAGLRLISNTAGGYGGGLYTDSALTLSDVDFISNTAGVLGGGMATFTSATVTGGSFISNTAGSSAGGLYVYRAATLTGVVFMSNTAVFYGGGIYALGAATPDPMVLSGTQFIGNWAGQAAGGLLAYENAILTNTDFISNSAEGGGGGGGLIVNGAATVTGGRFVSNTTQSVGGGLEAEGAGTTLTGTQFVGNFASIWGGGLGASYNITLTNVTFISNSATNSGGGVYAKTDTVLFGGSFVSNTTTNNGGGLWAQGAVTVTGSSFVSNTAGFGGGALAAGGAVRLSGASFVGNTAGSQGGGLYAFGSATIADSFFRLNTASSIGGGFGAEGTVIMTATQLVSNTALNAGGGAILTSSDANPGRLVNNLLAGNRSSGDGHDLVISLAAGSTILLHNTFADSEPVPGAALMVAAGTVGVTDTVFANQSTAIKVTGGAVFQDYNLFFDNGTNTSGAVSGGHSFVGNPAFADPAHADYHLTAASAAINAGANVGVTTDFEGDPRPSGGGFDIGFDEFLGPFTFYRNFLPLAQRW